MYHRRRADISSDAGLLFSLRSIFVHDTPDHGNHSGEGWTPSMGIEPLQGSPAAAPVISSRTEVSLSAPGVIAHCSCHTAFSEWMLLALRITPLSSRILRSCSRGSADPGTKVPDECVFSCQCSLKIFLSSPIGHFLGKNCAVLENFS